MPLKIHQVGGGQLRYAALHFVPHLYDMQKIKKAIIAALAAICLVALSYYALQFAGAFVLGYGWAKQANTAEKEIQSYLDSADIPEFIRECRLLMSKASMQQTEEVKNWTLMGDSLPDEWKERKVNYISYDAKSVYFSWTGGVLGPRGIRVENNDGRIYATAHVTPDSTIVLYSPVTGHIQTR